MKKPLLAFVFLLALGTLAAQFVPSVYNSAVATPTVIGAPAPVSGVSNANTASLSYSTTCAVLAKCALVLAVGTGGTQTSTPTCTDSASHTFTAGPTITLGSSSRIQLFYLYPEPSGLTSPYFCTLSPNRASELGLLEISGISTGINATPTGNTGSASSSTALTMSPVSTVTYDLMVGGYYWNSATAASIVTGTLKSQNNASATNGGSLALMTNTSGGTSGSGVTLALSTGSGVSWAGAALEVKP